MKSKLPIGLIFFAIILLLGSIETLLTIAKSNSHMIFFGQILAGLSFKEYYVGLALINFVIAVGLLYRQRWSFVSFMTISAWYAFVALVNIFVTTNETLVESGWKLTDKLSTSFSFRSYQVLVLIVDAVMVFWLFCYRKQFASGKR